MLPILEIPRRRRFLTTRIGTRVRELFGRDQSRSLPHVRFLTAEDAARERRPATSFYNFATGEVGLFYDETLDVETLWSRLTWHSLHEYLHWCLNFSPAQCGARDKVDATLLNVVADAANEQRAGLASEWCRDLLRRGRRTVLDAELAAPLPDSPLWTAAWLSLRAHTFLASRGWRLVERAVDGDAASTPDAVWTAIAPYVGPAPSTIAGRWQDAWRLLWAAWRADNQHAVFAAVRRLRELFPESERDAVPDSGPAGADDHPGSDAARPDEPPASHFGSGPVSPVPDERDAHATEAAAGEPFWDDSTAAHARPAPSADDLRASIDDDRVEEPREPIATEVAELLEEPLLWAPLKRRSPVTLSEYLSTSSGRALLAAAEPHGAELARKIEAIQAPSVRRAGARGRVRAGVIAKDPSHPRPFRERVREERRLAPGVFVGTIVDTSGSMGFGGRIDAAREAAMALTIACERTRTASVTVTSRGLVHVAGDGMPLYRAAAVLASLSPHGDEGFPHTLRPFLEEVSRRGEQVKTVVVVMDGMPVGADALIPIIAEYRRRGLFVIGLGLDLGPTERAGLERLFGADAVVATRARFAESLATVVSAAIARGSR
jgi:Mg-chelatase subunit ChlD